MGREFSFEGLRDTLSKGLNLSPLSPPIERSLRLAYDGHLGQFRELREGAPTKIPYVVHPVGVALTAHKLFSFVNLPDTYEDVIAVCLAHDLIEDTEIGAVDIERELSARVAEIVLALTKPLVEQNSSRDARNEAFIRQIIAAGPTAMFIKICDHCHNISRPGQSPTRLLDKAIRKGHSMYLRFFDDGRLPADFRAEYLRRLESAEAELREIKKFDRPQAVALNLDGAIRYCVTAAENKVLEPHDISDVLAHVTGSAFVKIATANDFISQLGRSPLAAHLVGLLNNMITSGRIDLKRLPKGYVCSAPFGESVIVIPLDHSATPKHDRFVFIGQTAQQLPDWLGVESLRVLVSYLSDRLRGHEREVVKGLAIEAVNLGLDVDMDDVTRLRLNRADLRRMRELLDFAEFSRQSLVGSFEYSGRRLPGGGVSFIEARVKTPRAILKKMVKRKMDVVDDVLGIRIVCISATGAAKVAEHVAEVISFHFPQATSFVEHAPSGTTKTESMAGYRAMHQTFAITAKDDPSMILGCEVQIRSAFQDAWARVSHELAYKKKGMNEQGRQDALKRLALLRDEADLVIDQLSGERCQK